MDQRDARLHPDHSGQGRPPRRHPSRAALGWILPLLLVACGTAGPATPTPATPTPQSQTTAPTTEGAPSAAPASDAASAGRAPVGPVGLGMPCGGALGACDAQGYCKFPDGAACGDGDVAGVCTARPRGCRRHCPRVCACDGSDLCNTCVARARGFSVRHAGRCAEAPAPTLEVNDAAQP